MKRGGEACGIGVAHSHLSLSKIDIEFSGQTLSFNPLLPLFAGMGIVVLSSALGVGGGFLLLPLLNIVLRLPMHIIAGTSALAITLHSLTSIDNYVRIGVELDCALQGLMFIGVIAGSVIVPLPSRSLPDKRLRGFLMMVLFLIGFRYLGMI